MIFGGCVLAGALIWPEFFFGIILAPTRFTFLSAAYLPPYISPYHLLFAGLVLGVGARVWASGRDYQPPSVPAALWAPFAALAGVMCIGLFQTPEPDYGIAKTAGIMSFCAFASIGALFVYRSASGLRALMIFLVLAGAGLSSLAVVSTGLVNATSTSVAGLGSNYILVQQMAGCAGLIIMYHLLPSGLGGWRQAGAWALLVLVIAGVILPGAKGPVLSFALAVVLAAGFHIASAGGWSEAVKGRLGRLVLFYPAVMVIVPGLLLAVYGGNVRVFMRIRDSLARISSSGITDMAIVERIENLRAAWGMFLANPVAGSGPGSFMAHAPRIEGLEPFRYPHNIIAELLAETGVLGTAAFACMLGFSVSKLYRLAKDRNSQMAVMGFGLLAFVLLCAMTSQDINNPALFFCLALPYVIERID